MSWLSRLALKPAGRLQFVQDAPGIQIQQPKPQVTDTARIAQLADALESLREELRTTRRVALNEEA